MFGLPGDFNLGQYLRFTPSSLLPDLPFPIRLQDSWYVLLQR